MSPSCSDVLASSTAVDGKGLLKPAAASGITVGAEDLRSAPSSFPIFGQTRYRPVKLQSPIQFNHTKPPPDDNNNRIVPFGSREVGSANPLAERMHD